MDACIDFYFERNSCSLEVQKLLSGSIFIFDNSTGVSGGDSVVRGSWRSSYKSGGLCCARYLFQPTFRVRTPSDVTMAPGTAFMELDAALLQMMGNVTLRDERIHRVVQTSSGDFRVAIDGDPSKPAIVTFHEVGLNSETTFDAFLYHPSAARLKAEFCFYHVNAPGQHPDCEEVVEVPDMQVIVESMKHVLRDLQVRRCVGLGYGAGAYIMIALAQEYSEVVSAVILINAVTDGPSCRDYLAINRACVELEYYGLTETVEEILFQYFCGELVFAAHKPLVTAFENKFKQQNPINLARFLIAFTKRETLSLNLKTPVLAVFGAESPNAYQTKRNLIGERRVEALEIPKCRLPLAETPQLVAREMIAFLQSLGLLSS